MSMPRSGSEVWITTKTESKNQGPERKLKGAQNQMTWIIKQRDLKSANEETQQYRNEWWSHIERMDETRTSKIASN